MAKPKFPGVSVPHDVDQVKTKKEVADMGIREKLEYLVSQLGRKRGQLPVIAIRTRNGHFHISFTDKCEIDDEGITVTRKYRIGIEEIKDVI